MCQIKVVFPRNSDRAVGTILRKELASVESHNLRIEAKFLRFGTSKNLVE